jgi:hypothetical protein
MVPVHFWMDIRWESAKMFMSFLPPHARTALTGVLLAFGLLVATDVAAGDLRPAKAWLDEIPPLPRNWSEVNRTCQAIRGKGAAIHSAYERESNELDAQIDDPGQMSDEQAMAMLMQKGGVQEIQRFAQAQMQMVDTAAGEEVPALMKRKEQTEEGLAVLAREMDDEIRRCLGNLPDCGRDGEGMTAAEAACWQQRKQQVKQCRRDAANGFLASARTPLHEWKADLRIYLNDRESDLLEQETSHRNEYLRAQWKRARIELLEQAADYADLAVGACHTVEGLRLAESDP